MPTWLAPNSAKKRWSGSRAVGSRSALPTMSSPPTKGFPQPSLCPSGPLLLLCLEERQHWLQVAGCWAPHSPPPGPDSAHPSPHQVTVKSGLDELMDDLLQEAHSDLERVRAIWIWICHHIGRTACEVTGSRTP